MKKKTLFKPAALAGALVAALFTLAPAQANAAMNMLQAIEAAENYSGGYAESADRKGSKKRGRWEIDIIYPDGSGSEVSFDIRTGGFRGDVPERFDFEERFENAFFFRQVDSKKFFSLEESVREAENTWPGSHAEEASFEAAEPAEKDDDDDDWDDHDDDDDWDDRDDDDDDRDDDDDDRDNDDDRAKPAMYEIELKKGHREREVEIRADRRTPY